jgi:hypothetical protein
LRDKEKEIEPKKEKNAKVQQYFVLQQTVILTVKCFAFGKSLSPPKTTAGVQKISTFAKFVIIVLLHKVKAEFV